jgi:5-methylcytosine-specific restriction endonuclease McrA
MKTCVKCETEKPENEFRRMAKTGKNQNYLRSYCRPCDNDYERITRRAYRKNWQLKKAYNISLDEYQSLFDLQNGKCAICNSPETDSTNGIVHLLAVDHNHDTGEVRGLLCKKCNTAIGLLNHEQGLLDRAKQYLRSCTHE